MEALRQGLTLSTTWQHGLAMTLQSTYCSMFKLSPPTPPFSGVTPLFVIIIMIMTSTSLSTARV